jgi:hypothetical protein
VKTDAHRFGGSARHARAGSIALATLVACSLAAPALAGQRRVYSADSSSRTPRFSAETSVLAGKGVEIFHEPFSIRPRDDCRPFQGCIGSGQTAHALRSSRVTVDGVDGDFVIPILSGFDVRYEFDDEHVRSAGAFLDDIAFDLGTGDLSYTVNTIVLDKNDSPGFAADFNVTLLVLNERS